MCCGLTEESRGYLICEEVGNKIKVCASDCFMTHIVCNFIQPLHVLAEAYYALVCQRQSQILFTFSLNVSTSHSFTFAVLFHLE